MVVSIATKTFVSVEGQKPWYVHRKLVALVGDVKFVRMPGSNCPQLRRCIFGIKTPRGMSLSQTDGHKKLKQLINDAQQASFADATNDNRLQELFEVAPKKKKKQRGREPN